MTKERVNLTVDPDGNPLCQCCDARMWVSTGVWVCPANAMTVAWIQDRWLTRALDELRLEDLFDVFEILEKEHHALLEGPRPPSPWDQDEVDPRVVVVWAWSRCERIRQEATKLVGLKTLAKGTQGGWESRR